MPNPIALAIPFFFLLIAIEWVVARRMGLQVYRFNDAITDLSCGITQQVTGLFLRVLVLAPYVWLYAHGRTTTLSDTAISTHVLAFLGVDLGYYLWHRFTHETNLGWATHVVHHQSEDYNLAVALRQSVTSALTSWPFLLPLALLGVSPLVVFTHSALNTLYQFWIHTETIDRLGPIERVLNTPSHHRVHHAINARYVDRNYAGVLIVWDRDGPTRSTSGSRARAGVRRGSCRTERSFRPRASSRRSTIPGLCPASRRTSRPGSSRWPSPRPRCCSSRTALRPACSPSAQRS